MYSYIPFFHNTAYGKVIYFKKKISNQIYILTDILAIVDWKLPNDNFLFILFTDRKLYFYKYSTPHDLHTKLNIFYSKMSDSLVQSYLA